MSDAPTSKDAKADGNLVEIFTESLYALISCATKTAGPIAQLYSIRIRASGGFQLRGGGRDFHRAVNRLVAMPSSSSFGSNSGFVTLPAHLSVISKIFI